MNDEMLSTGKAAKILGVSSQTIRRYVKEGRFAAIKFGPKNLVRIRRGDLIGFMTASEVDPSTTVAGVTNVEHT